MSNYNDRHPLKVMRVEMHAVIDRFFDNAERYYAKREAERRATAKANQQSSTSMQAKMEVPEEEEFRVEPAPPDENLNAFFRSLATR